MKRALPLVLGFMLGFLAGIGFVSIFGRLDRSVKISEIFNSSDENSDIKIGYPAPGFELESLEGTRRLSDYQGKVVLINFWATWCGPCKIEMPLFQDVQEKYSNDLVVLAINGQDNQIDIEAYMEDLGLNFEVLMDPDGEVHHQYLVRGFPTTILVDREGKVRIQHVGLITEDQLIDYLREFGF